MSKLFSVPVSTGGSFECTSPSENIYLLSFSSAPDNRVTIPFLNSFLLSLNIIEHKYPKGVLIATSGITKFYSNGFNLDEMLATPRFWEDGLNPLLRRLLTYPMPTIALVNGHTFGAGVFLALAHDYRVQNPSRGFICLPEVDMGVVIPTDAVILMKHKLSPTAYRTAAFEGKRIGGPEALQLGIVDALGGLDEVLKLIAEKDLVKKGQTGSYGGIKEDAYSEILAGFERHDENIAWRARIDSDKEKRDGVYAKQVTEWESKSKL